MGMFSCVWIKKKKNTNKLMFLVSNDLENKLIPDSIYTNIGKRLLVPSSLGLLFFYLNQLKMLFKRSCWLINT